MLHARELLCSVEVRGILVRTVQIKLTEMKVGCL